METKSTDPVAQRISAIGNLRLAALAIVGMLVLWAYAVWRDGPIELERVKNLQRLADVIDEANRQRAGGDLIYQDLIKSQTDATKKQNQLIEQQLTLEREILLQLRNRE